MILQKLFKLGLTLALGLTLTSCGNNGCEKTRESIMKATFKATGKINMVSINAWALTAEGDSLMTLANAPTEMEFILKPDTTFTQIRLACTINEDDDLFQFDDTLMIKYEYYPYFLDMECGCSIYFNIQEATITNNVFKSIKLKNNEITNEEKVNIELTY